MAVFGTEVDRPLYGRGPSPGLRFTIYALLSVVLMYYDQHGQWEQHLRFALQAAAYPVQVAVNSPSAAWRTLTARFEGQADLRTENERLRAHQRELELQVMRASALEQENAELRQLRDGLPPLIKTWQLAEVILVTDPEHAIPVAVVRNSLRSIAIGSGNSGELLLPYLAVNSDVKGGDLLVSSGLGGVFPAGLPVARISGVRRESNQLLAQVRAQPLAHVDHDREVILLQFEPSHPDAPAPNPPIAPVPAAPAKPPPKIPDGEQ